MNDKIQKKNLIFFCFASVVIVTVFTFNFSSSRYIGTIIAEDDVLAIPVLTLSNNNQTYSISNMVPGDIKEYTFYVSNEDGENVNEVLLSYYFEVNLDTTIPLEAKIYEINGKNENEIQITGGITKSIELGIVRTETNKAMNKYKLKICWDKSNNNYEYSGKTASCDITLKAEQVV